ncbi:MAG: ABC transporter permease subunit [Acidimicrobiia bacterium]|nr:ABC transporter permease subunit [Acidimicrobiia bacterium]
MTRWLRRNLFRGPVDAVVSATGVALALYVLYRAVRFVAVTGRWDVVRLNLKLLLVGRYPDTHLPRVAVSLVVGTGVAALVAGIVHRRQRDAGTFALAGAGTGRRMVDVFERLWPVLLGAGLLLGLSGSPGPWVTAAGVAGAAVTGRLLGVAVPRKLHAPLVAGAIATPFLLIWYLADGSAWDSWGGLMLNVFMAVAAILMCFPLGVFAALGRQSQLPLISATSTAYIELFRGAPLFVLLLMANVALGFFVPAGTAPGRVVRAIVVFSLFTGAYVAEIVRGGLQSLPQGQTEAGRALGLSATRITFLIVLPQALRNVIPAQVGQFISLFKDTTLAGAAMGLFELLQVGQAVTRQGPFAGQGLLPESLAFVGLLFWLGSYTMSRESQRIEAKLGVGTR